MIECLLDAKIFSGISDDDAKLDLPVGFLGPQRDLDVIVRTYDGTGGL
jgi:hypothetical protein